MRHLDEETLHAFIDGEVLPIEEAAVEHHVAHCAQCAAALAEARGLVAAASRVVIALDEAPASPRQVEAAAPMPGARAPRKVFSTTPYLRVAAVLLVVVGSAAVFDRVRAPKSLIVTDASAIESNTAVDGLAEDQAATSLAAAPAAANENAPGAQAAPVRRRVAGTGAAGGASGADGAPEATRRYARNSPRLVQRSEVTTASKQAAPPPVISTSPSTPPMELASPVRNLAASDASAASAAAPESPPPETRITRYRLEDGTVLILIDEPLDTAQPASRPFASRESAPATVMAPNAAVVVLTTFRWTNPETKRRYHLSAPISEDALRAAANRLGELQRLP